MSKVKQIIAALFISALTAAFAIAQTEATQAQPEAKELLRKVHANYANIKTYHFEGQSVVEMKGDGIFMRMEMPFAVAVGKNGQRLMRKKIFSVNTFQVSDGQTEWVYMPADKQYTKKPVEKGAASDDALFNLARVEAMKLATIADDQIKDLKTARIVREEALDVGGQHINCYVIEAEFSFDSAEAATAKNLPTKETPTSIPMLFWVDKERSIILRSEFDGGGALAELFKVFGEGAVFKMSAMMSVAKVNETLPDSLFAFTPPTDAREVEKLESRLTDLLEEEEDVAPVSLVGKDASNFTLSDLNGKSFSLAKLRGKVVVIDFWASWCGPCRETMPHVEKLHREFKDKGLVVLGINDEDIDDIRQFVQKNGYTFPTLIDVESAVSELYGVSSIPQTLIIDRDGKVFAHFYGTGEEENLREAVKIALETKETKAEAAKPVKRQVARAGARKR